MSKDIDKKTINNVKISTETYKKIKIIGIDRELPPPEVAGEILDKVIDNFLERAYKKTRKEKNNDLLELSE